MTSPSKKAISIVALLLGILAGATSLWLTQRDDSRRFDGLKKIAICVVHLPEQKTSVSATFTTTRPVEMFHVGFRKTASDEPVSILIAGDQGPVASFSGIESSTFGLGRAIKPGAYTIALQQETSGKGATVVIADEEPPYVTGWQMMHRTYVGLLVLSGVFVVLWRNEKDSNIAAASITAFHSLLLGLVLIFVYLLFHEGGHALAQIAFGRFDLARSDFWGIYGHPHSGSTMGPPLEPWKQVLISCAGPMLPTFVGFGLFLLWCSPMGRKARSLRPMLNLYFSAVVAALVFSEAVCEPAYLLGLIDAEGDLIGYATKSGGPVWLVKGFLWSTFLVSTFILWQVLPEVWKSWKNEFMDRWEFAISFTTATHV
jgi:hypothetical protein